MPDFVVVSFVSVIPVVSKFSVASAAAHKGSKEPPLTVNNGVEVLSKLILKVAAR